MSGNPTQALTRSASSLAAELLILRSNLAYNFGNSGNINFAATLTSRRERESEMDTEKYKFIISLLEYPEETSLTEYKSAVKFEPKSEFAAKLVKHIFGQANNGGGYIVIGFREDSSGKLLLDDSLDEFISKSYETTSLCQTVDSFLSAGQRIALQVHKVEFKGQIFPVISVQEFRGSPYFCRKDHIGADKKPILREGTIYIRDVAAKTVAIAGPEHWNAILKTAVGQQQSEQLEHLRNLLGQMGLGIPDVNSTAKSDVIWNQSWIESKADVARKKLQELYSNTSRFEIAHFPEGIPAAWDQERLVDAARKAVVRKTGWPIGVVMGKPEFAPQPLADGIEAMIDAANSFDYWALNRNGTFYFLRRLDEDGDWDRARRGQENWVYFDTRIWRVAEALLHCSNLYEDLDVAADTPISIRIDHSGLRGRVLGAGNRMRAMHWRRSTGEDAVSWSKTVPLGSIQPSLADLTKEITRELFMVFEFWEPTDHIYREVFNEFSKSSM